MTARKQGFFETEYDYRVSLKLAELVAENMVGFDPKVDGPEDAMVEGLEEHFQDQAEEWVQEHYYAQQEPGICCGNYTCPCGNGTMGEI